MIRGYEELWALRGEGRYAGLGSPARVALFVSESEAIDFAANRGLLGYEIVNVSDVVRLLASVPVCVVRGDSVYGASLAVVEGGES